MSMLNENMQALADAAAASLEEAAATGELVEWLEEAITWTAPEADGTRIVRLGMGPDVSAMVTPGDPRNANAVYATWWGGLGTCRISDYAAEKLLETLQDIEAC